MGKEGAVLLPQQRAGAGRWEPCPHRKGGGGGAGGENWTARGGRKTGIVVPLGLITAAAFHHDVSMSPQYEQVTGATACQGPTGFLSNN